MQLKSLLIGAALLSNFALLTYGRAVELSRTDVAITKPPGEVAIHHEIEPRAFTKLKNKMKDAADSMRNKNEKDKDKDDDPSGGGAAGASDDLRAPMDPPAKYDGPVPNGMGQDPELKLWNEFLDVEITVSKEPPKSGGYLMYSGPDISSPLVRGQFKDLAEQNPSIGPLHDWDNVFGGSKAMTMWDGYRTAHPDKAHVQSFAVSFAQARRAAQSKPELHMLFNDKDEPLMRDRSFWGAVEAGIITGPNSKVNKIWRYNNDEVAASGSLPPPILAWDRELHFPFGKKIEELDWRVYPKGEDQPNGELKEALPKVPSAEPPQLDPLEFEPLK